MKTLKIGLISWILTLTISSSMAQNHPECLQHREVIKSERIAFITEQLQLSVKEAQLFWPIYNQHNAAIEKLREKKHKEMTALNADDETLREYEYQAFIDKYIYFIEEETRLDKQFQKDLSKIFSAKKIFELYKAEKNFKRKLVKELRGKKPACLE